MSALPTLCALNLRGACARDLNSTEFQLLKICPTRINHRIIFALLGIGNPKPNPQAIYQTRSDYRTAKRYSRKILGLTGNRVSAQFTFLMSLCDLPTSRTLRSLRHQVLSDRFTGSFFEAAEME